jgi:hypothetical protein
MEVEYRCELCEKIFSSVFSLSNHKRLYHENEKDDRRAKNKEDNMYYCRFCDKKYKHYSSRTKHEKKCKPIENPLEQVLQENIQIKEEAEQIKAERDAYKDKIIKLQDKLIKTTRLTTKSFKALNKILMEKSYMNQSNNTNSLNTITNNHNNTLQICTLGSEDILNVLTEQQKRQIINAKFKSLDKLIEITHCGSYNQFKNILITNLKDEFAYKYDGSKGFFVTVKKNDIITDMLDYRIYNINEIYDEIENGIDENTKTVIRRFMEKCENDEPFEDDNGTRYPNYKEYKKDCVKILLYNNHDQITKSIASLIEEHEAETKNITNIPL